jgi:hypothetical protein
LTKTPIAREAPRPDLGARMRPLRLITWRFVASLQDGAGWTIVLRIKRALFSDLVRCSCRPMHFVLTIVVDPCKNNRQALFLPAAAILPMPALPSLDSGASISVSGATVCETNRRERAASVFRDLTVGHSRSCQGRTGDGVRRTSDACRLSAYVTP